MRGRAERLGCRPPAPANLIPRLAGTGRFDLKYGMGGLAHEALMTNIAVYGTQVIPRVREFLADADARPASGNHVRLEEHRLGMPAATYA